MRLLFGKTRIPRQQRVAHPLNSGRRMVARKRVPDRRIGECIAIAVLVVAAGIALLPPRGVQNNSRFRSVSPSPMSILRMVTVRPGTAPIVAPASDAGDVPDERSHRLRDLVSMRAIGVPQSGPARLLVPPLINGARQLRI